MATIKNYDDDFAIESAIKNAKIALVKLELEYKNLDPYNYITIFGFSFKWDEKSDWDDFHEQCNITGVKDDINALQNLLSMIEYNNIIDINNKEFNLIKRYKND